MGAVRHRLALSLDGLQTLKFSVGYYLLLTWSSPVALGLQAQGCERVPVAVAVAVRDDDGGGSGHARLGRQSECSRGC